MNWIEIHNLAYGFYNNKEANTYNMNEEELQKLDELYIKYGYESKHHKSARVYVFTKSIYNGADIYCKDSVELVEIKKQYSKAGYAVKVRDFNTLDEAEDILFKDFFKSEGVLENLRRKYHLFVDKLMVNLPEGASYEYIRSDYEYTEYEYENDDFETKCYSANDESNSLINKLVEKITYHQGPLLIIIEAAAGYGKTCSAYEFIKEFISIPSNKLPFFTELSRDRKASLFKHILAFEIEDQFSNRVDSTLVISQIKKGRIPIIIDGFDELISKDFSFSSNQFEQVESMLSTIVDLLTDNAKIIITSRRTAIFNSEEFHSWMIDRNINYKLIKVAISEPRIENWLSKDRLEIINQNNFPVKEIANPVLLTYLRYIDMASLIQMILDDKSIVDRYFDFLLKREQDRQGLLMEPEMQLRVFRKLVRFLTEWDIKSESRHFIKDLILDYNMELLEETRKKYTPAERPRIDQLADILSNHAFLDRKEKNMIGIINEFVFGTLIGENLVLDKFKKYNPKFYETVSQMFALMAVQAYKVQPYNNKIKLWEVFNEYPFNYDQEFYFKIDIEFKNEVSRTYSQATLNDYVLNGYKFTGKKLFESVVFTSFTFQDCQFSFSSFSNTSFVNCKFYNCELLKNGEAYSDCYFSLYGCSDDNGFVQNVFNCQESSIEEVIPIEKEIMELYFKVGSYKSRPKQLSSLKNELNKFDFKTITKAIHKLETLGYIDINGDLSHLTKNGVLYYNDTYRN